MSICARISFLALSLFEVLAWHREALISERCSFLSKLAAAHVIVVVIVVGVVVITTSLAPATALFILERRLLILLLSRKLSHVGHIGHIGHVGHIEPSTWEGELVEVSSHSTSLALIEL